ncbi:MAG: DUF3592 domain-containing protein [Verrucomicrobiota bacterium]
MSQTSENPPSLKTTAPGSAAGRWYLAILGLILAFIGGVFVMLMGRSFLRAREMQAWPEVTCVILSSEVEERRHDENSPSEFRQDLSFGYTWKGEAHTGDHLTLRGSPWSSNRGLAEARVAEYPVGMTTTCHIDPAAPDFAVLKTDSLAPGYSIWFPALFVIGGLGISVRAAMTRRA